MKKTELVRGLERVLSLGRELEASLGRSGVSSGNEFERVVAAQLQRLDREWRTFSQTVGLIEADVSGATERPNATIENPTDSAEAVRALVVPISELYQRLSKSDPWAAVLNQCGGDLAEKDAADSGAVLEISHIQISHAQISTESIDRLRRSLQSFVVPIERLLGRTVRDEEFLYFESDQDRVQKSATASHGTALCGVDSDEMTSPSRNAHSNHLAIVALENLRSAFNVGAIYRTAECFAFDAVWKVGYTPDPQKTAMGTDAKLQSERFVTSNEVIERARALGCAVIALEKNRNSVSVSKFQWPDRFVLIAGNERFGVNSETLAQADHVVHVDLYGTKNSLNVGIAFGIAANSAAAATASALPSESAQAALSGETEVGAAEISMEPIGVIEGGHSHRQSAPRQPRSQVATQAQMEVDELGGLSSCRQTAVIRLNRKWRGRPSLFDQALKDLKGFNRIWLLWHFSKASGYRPMVSPPKGNSVKRGVFATRSPHHPNAIGLSSVELLFVNREKFEIMIGDCDLLDGTPILDIKPYLSSVEAHPEASRGWLDEAESHRYQITFTPDAAAIFDDMSSRPDGLFEVRQFIFEQLSFEPLNSDRKRIEIVEPLTDRGSVIAVIAFRMWRIRYEVFPEARSVLILSVA